MFALAIREMQRSKVRFGLLSAAIGLLVFLILFQQALLNGLVKDFVGAVRNQNAPILVFNEQAAANVEGSFLLAGQVSDIQSVAGVQEARTVVQGTFTVQTSAVTGPQEAVLFGYTLDRLGEPTSLDAGRLPTDTFEVVATSVDGGRGFALDDEVVVVGSSSDVTLTVVGTVADARLSVSPTMFGSASTFSAVAFAVNPRRPPLPSFVAVRAAVPGDEAALVARINAEVEGVEALTNDEAARQNPAAQGVSQSFSIILALAFLVVAIVVGFFFLILTSQKSQSLTLLRAIGAPRGYLVRNLMAQVVLVMAFGIAIGVVLSQLAIKLAANSDASISLDPATVVSTVIALSVLGFLGAIASIRRVLKIDPVEAVSRTGASR